MDVGPFKLCENCPNQSMREKLANVNAHFNEMPPECLLLAYDLFMYANCKGPVVEIDLPEDDIVEVDRHCGNRYAHDIFRVLRAGEIIRMHQKFDPNNPSAE